jgi:hypothetical protein
MVSKEKLKELYGHDKDICEIYIVKNNSAIKISNNKFLILR